MVSRSSASNSLQCLSRTQHSNRCRLRQFRPIMNRFATHIFFCSFHTHKYDKQEHHIKANQLASACQTPKYLSYSYEAYIRCVNTKQLRLDIVISASTREEIFFLHQIHLTWTHVDTFVRCAVDLEWVFLIGFSLILRKHAKWKKTCSIIYVFLFF